MTRRSLRASIVAVLVIGALSWGTAAIRSAKPIVVASPKPRATKSAHLVQKFERLTDLCEKEHERTSTAWHEFGYTSWLCVRGDGRFDEYDEHPQDRSEEVTER